MAKVAKQFIDDKATEDRRANRAIFRLKWLHASKGRKKFHWLTNTLARVLAAAAKADTQGTHCKYV